MTMWRMLRCGALSNGAKMGKETMSNLSIVSKQLGSERKRLMKNKPYVYLTIIGVSSTAQGKGFGSKLINTITEEYSRDGLYLYLETEKKENLPFYNKHGLTVLKDIVFEKINLLMWLMSVSL